MKGNFRLTVHLEDQPKVDTRAPKVITKKGPQKTAVDTAKEEARKHRSNTPTVSSKGRYKVYTTLSFHCKTQEDCLKKLSDIKTKYTIAKGKNRNKMHKYDKELYNISFIK